MEDTVEERSECYKCRGQTMEVQHTEFRQEIYTTSASTYFAAPPSEFPERLNRARSLLQELRAPDILLNLDDHNR